MNNKINNKGLKKNPVKKSILVLISIVGVVALLSCEDSTDEQTTTPSLIAITGTLRYTDINTNVGIAITRTPLWSGQTNVAQTVSYSIDPEVA